MREIKYRVWDSEYKAYVQDYSDYVINPNGELLFYDIDGVFKSPNMKVCTIEQCTGIKDKNGKEIYEGDVIRFTRNVGPIYKPTIASNICVIRLIREKASYRMCYNTLQQKFHSMYSDSYEVIGNIHDNPELLEVHHE